MCGSAAVWGVCSSVVNQMKSDDDVAGSVCVYGYPSF